MAQNFQSFIEYFINQLNINSGLVALLSLTISSIFGIIVLTLTHSLELKKFRQNLLLEKKYNAYFEYFSLFNEFYSSSSEIVFNFAQLKNKAFENEAQHDEFKAKVMQQFQEFTRIRAKLVMPGAEKMIFMNKKINDKMEELINIDDCIPDLDANVKENAEKMMNIIKKTLELIELMKKDLEIK